MYIYQIILIVRKNATKNKRIQVLQTLCNLIQTFKGSIKSIQYSGIHPLTFNQEEIKKESQGKYIIMNFIVPPSYIQEIEHNLKINSYIVRYFITKTSL